MVENASETILREYQRAIIQYAEASLPRRARMSIYEYKVRLTKAACRLNAMQYVVYQCFSEDDVLAIETELNPRGLVP